MAFEVELSPKSLQRLERAKTCIKDESDSWTWKNTERSAGMLRLPISARKPCSHSARNARVSAGIFTGNCSGITRDSRRLPCI